MNTKERFLQASRQLFQLQGFHGTGLNQILEISKAPKGSFYHHFPEGKTQLAAESLLEAGDELTQMMRHVQSKADHPKEAITQFIRKVGTWFKKSGYSAGCPITSVMLDTVPSERLTTQASQAVFGTWIGAWQTYFELHLVDSQDAHTLSVALIASIEGAWIVSRALQTLSAFDAVELALLSHWDAIQ